MKTIKKISKWFWEKDDIVQIILTWFYAFMAVGICYALFCSAFPIMGFVAFILLLSFGVVVLSVDMKI